MSAAGLPLVSVIIAAYNAAPYVAYSVYSVLEQSHGAVEVIVVDDGSTDATADIVQALACQDRRVVLITGHGNEGVSAARNRGLARARGEWLAILDADDLFHEKRLEQLVGFAIAQGLDLAADNLEMRDFVTGEARGNAFPDAWMDATSDVTIADFLQRDLPGMFTRELGFIKPVIRAAFLRTHGICYERSLWAAEDILLYLNCLQHGARLRLMPAAHYIYHLRAGSASSGRNANLEVQRCNDLLLDTVGKLDPMVRDLLLLRRMLILYELFNWRVKSHEMVKAAALAVQLPAGFLCSKLGAALMRRLGMAAGNPSLRALQRLRERWMGNAARAPAL